MKKNKKMVLAASALAIGLSAQPASAGWFDWLFGKSTDTYTATKHPIVLVHGLSGFNKLFGIVEYFNGVPDALTESGAEVFVPQVSAANSTEVRGEQLLAQIEEYMAVTGAEKVHLIGHSHGGPTIRYVAGVRPDLIASVSSVGGVNWGTPVADAFNTGALDNLGNWFFGLLDTFSGGGGLPQDTGAAIASLSTEGSLQFNERFSAGIPSTYCGNDGAEVVDGVRYYSWGGNKISTNFWDVSDPLLKALEPLFDEPTDGLVPACSMKLGKVLGVDYGHNHLDQVNMLFGLVGRNAADPVELYRQQANRLKNLGL
ncbi:esterase/lipase family protein [Marinobacter sp.]|uniref:esterase/lipase family protein n=1 Tax=Marinobacter sp. TaxID=50741 RepID=UPI00356B25BA